MRVIDYFDNGVRYYPNNVAFVDVDREGLSMTYAEARPRTERIAGAIRGNGYGKGAHVGILAPNCTVAFLALLGLFRAEASLATDQPAQHRRDQRRPARPLRWRAAALSQRLRGIRPRRYWTL